MPAPEICRAELLNLTAESLRSFRLRLLTADQLGHHAASPYRWSGSVASFKSLAGICTPRNFLRPFRKLS